MYQVLVRSLWLSLWESSSEEGNCIIGEVITEKDPGNLAPFSFSFLGSKSPTAFSTLVLCCMLSHRNTKTIGSSDRELDTPDYEPKQRFLILKVPCLWDSICFYFHFFGKNLTLQLRLSLSSDLSSFLSFIHARITIVNHNTLTSFNSDKN